MAFADLGSLGAIGNTNNNQTSLVLTTTAAVAVGELVVVVVAVDNPTNGGDSGVASVTNSGAANTWAKAIQVCNAVAAQGGASVSIWYTKATAAMASGATITATFSNATTSDASAMTARHFSTAADVTVAIEGTPGTLVGNTAADPGSLNVTTANIACLRVRGIASQVGNNTNLTPTVSWTAWANGNSATTGTTGEMCARAEHIISTATGAASDPTYVSAIYASAYVAFKEVAVVISTGSGVLAAQACAVSGSGVVKETFFDPNYKGTDLVLSNNNLTVTKTVSTAYASTLSSNVRGTKVYAELHLDVEAPGQREIGLGIANVAANLNDYAGGADGNSLGYFGNGSVFVGDALIGTTATYAAGDWIGVAVDAVAQTVAFRNITQGGSWSSNFSIAALGGPLHFIINCYRPTDAWTVNFDSVFIGAPPADFTKWDGDPPAVPPAIGTGTLAAQAASLAGSGTVAATVVSGSGVLAVQAASLVGAASSQSQAAAATLVAQSAVVAGAGTVRSQSTVAVLAAQPAVIAGAGVVSAVATGALAVQPATLAGVGTVWRQASGTLVAGAALVAGAGVSSGIATGALVQQTHSAVGSGTQLSADSGALQARSAIIAAQASVIAIGNGALAAQSSTVTASGVGSSAAVGALTARAATVVGASSSISVGTGALVQQAHAIAGTGAVLSANTGMLFAQAANLAGQAVATTVTSATGVLTAQAAAVAGVGTPLAIAAGTLAVQSSAMAGAALASSSAVGVLAAQPAVVNGVASGASVATGELAVRAAAVAGAGVVLAASDFDAVGVLRARAARIKGAGYTVISLNRLGRVGGAHIRIDSAACPGQMRC